MISLVLIRDLLAPDYTAGTLFVDGVQQCYTLELPVKDGLPGSAIPPGTYPVVLAESPKFMASTDPWVMQFASSIPHIYQIPNRTNILVHWGNSPQDTEGCILVGQERGSGDIMQSRAAFEALHAKLNEGEIQLTVQGGIPES